MQISSQPKHASPACRFEAGSVCPSDDGSNLRMKLIKSLIKGALFALTGALLLLNGNARAAIGILDGGTNAASTIITGNAVQGISLPFTVSSGASVLVVTLFDGNSDNLDVGPVLYWTNSTTATVTPLTQFSTFTGYGFTWDDIYYLTNPPAGTGVVGGVETNSGVGGMFMQAYTLTGVDTTIAPVQLNENSLDLGGNTTLLTVTTPTNTVSGSWASIVSEQYNGGSGHYVTNLSTSGTVTQNLYQDTYVGQLDVGYIAGLQPGSSTISAASDASGAMNLAAVVFAPVVAVGIPTNLVATSELNQVKLTWADSSGGVATGYIVLRSTISGSGYTAIATNNGNASTTYTDNVTSYVNYYYVVEAVKAGGQTSPNSTQILGYGIGLPGQVTSLTATPDVNQVDLNWSTQFGATGYKILRSTTSGSNLNPIGTAGTNGYIDASVTDGTLYYYEVVSTNTAGSAAASSQVSAIPVVKFFTNSIGVFDSSSDIASWSATVGTPPAAITFYGPPDVTSPPLPSLGCIDMEATYGPSYTNNAQYAIAQQFASINLSGYRTLEMDIENPTGIWDEFNQLQAIQVSLQLPIAGIPNYVQDNSRFITLFAATGGNWSHYVFPMSDWTNNAPNLDNVTGLQLSLYDGDCVPDALTLDVAYANISFCHAPAWTPIFTVSSQTIGTGSTSVTLSGTISSVVGGSTDYLAINTPVNVTINGSTQSTTINDATGDFSIAFNTTGFANGTYPVTYSTPDDMVSLVAASNNSTTLTLTTHVPPTAPTILPVSVDGTGANLTVKVPTQSGYTYYLLTTTNLAPPEIWSTNTSFAGTGGTVTTPVPLNASQKSLFIKFMVH